MPRSIDPIRFEDVSFSFGKKKVLENLNFNIEKGKTYSIIGESGSGKTTSLRLINGLLKPNSGHVLIDEEPFDYKNAEIWRRHMGYSIQGSGLFPHMSLIENMSLIARKSGWKKDKIEKRALELCELINLPNDKSFLRKKPRQISGGQQQRVGIARAIFMAPKILLMDEPFGALDPITREEIHEEFLKLQEKLKLTIVLVTHDISEAFKMSDELIILQEGKLAQKGRPSQLLLKPSNNYVKKYLETNSPNHLLKSVKLYSIANTDIYVSRKEGDLFIVTHKDSGEAKTFSHLDHVFEFHVKQEQHLIYWIDQDNTLQYSYALEPKGLKVEEMLYSRDHILSGMKLYFESSLPAIPIVDAHNKLLGVFSKEAIDGI